MIPVDSCCSLDGASGIEILQSVCHLHSLNLSHGLDFSFNPSTGIKYELPRASHVSLSVFDILGREVAVLVHEEKNAGYHETRFDGSGLPSGAYFYRLSAGDFAATRRLILLR